MLPKNPDIIFQSLDLSRPGSEWVVVAASVQGTSHVKAGLPCQDAHASLEIGGSTLVAAVADGLGSAAFAQQGARLAVAGALSYLEQELLRGIPQEEAGWVNLVRESFLFARSMLEAEAQENQAELRDYGTTLIVAILSTDWLVTGHIGDGAVVALLENGSLSLISAPQNEEYANVTFPLTMPDMESVAEFKAEALQAKALALLSDGVQQVSIRTADHTPHSPFFEPLFRQLPMVKDRPKASRNLGEFLASERICAHTDDDKTLVLIGRH